MVSILANYLYFALYTHGHGDIKSVMIPFLIKAINHILAVVYSDNAVINTCTVGDRHLLFVNLFQVWGSFKFLFTAGFVGDDKTNNILSAQF